MKYQDLQYLAVALPEAIEKEKWSGNFENARKRIRHCLAAADTEYALRCRLELELEHLDNLESRYTVDAESALEIMHERIPSMTAEELEELRMEDKADWIYLNGKVMYIDCFADTLYKVYPQIWNRTEDGDTSDYGLIEDYIHSRADGQTSTAHIHMRHELKIGEAALKEGRKICVHMPLPCNRDGISKFKLLNSSHTPTAMSDEKQPQPTFYFETVAKKGEVFSLEYELDCSMTYHRLDGYLSENPEINIPSVTEKDIELAGRETLLEEKPHIVFTPYLSSLCKEIVGEEKNPLKAAKRIYDFVTTKTDYRFVRDYASIDNLPEYCALNRRGDCGVQSLLFITLCRIAGIPAQWQSGLEAVPDYVGEHDWAIFYIPKLGWLHADLAGGALAYARGHIDRWNFFFGNADPYRIPINNGFQRDFEPKKNHLRLDPYDNQCGEIEYEDCGVYGEALEYKYTPIDIYLK